MTIAASHKFVYIVLAFVIVVIIVVASNFLFIKYSGTPVPEPEITRQAVTIGSGKKLNYAVFGDSTSVAQGGDYNQGYVVKTAEKLSENYQVTYQNFGVSGARINDVLTDQLPAADNFAGDFALIAVGANDVTHLTSLKLMESDMRDIIASLRKQNSNVKIIFTGSAAMGTVKRFPQPAKALAGWQTTRVNKMMERISAETNVTFAYIASRTEKTFKDNPQYFASDNFHPNNDGYAIWTKVLNEVIAESLN